MEITENMIDHLVNKIISALVIDHSMDWKSSTYAKKLTKKVIMKFFEEW